jgi:hypothetical protein
MGLFQGLINFDKAFQTVAGKKPTILNEVEAFTDHDVDQLNKLLTTTYSGDMLSNIPVCACDEDPLSGTYNLGVKCRRCGVEVQPVLGVDLQAMTWIRSPNGVEKLINPQVWLMLKNRFSISNFNVLMWLADPSYRPPVNEPPVLMQIKAMTIRGKPIERGYNFFVKNFHDILDQLFELKNFRKKKGETDSLRIVLRRYAKNIFSSHMPVPHRSVLVIEDTHSGSYVDDLTPDAKDAILTMAGVDSNLHVFSQVIKEGRTARCIDKYSAFISSVYQDKLARKEGLIRKHGIASRANWSFRAVIGSITRAHDHECISIPWGVATSVFRTFVSAKLIVRGFTPNEIIKFLNDHAERYHPELDAIFKELIREAPSGKGIAASLNRNPSLQRGSIQRVYINEVKPDPMDNTVSMSIIVVNSPNADFDGRLCHL